MSSSPTAPTSTTGSSTSSRSATDRSTRTALVACGALAQPAAAIAARRGWPLDVHPLPPLLHNRPERIAGEVRRTAAALLPAYRKVVVGYADCGTYGALDEVCRELGLARLEGLHCYDLYAGAERLERFFDEQPGTYVLTDFLVRSFARTVLQELGLDRWPELRDAYFAALHARGVAGPGAGRRAAGAGRGRRGPARPAADGRGDRRLRSRAGARRGGRGDLRALGSGSVHTTWSPVPAIA